MYIVMVGYVIGVMFIMVISVWYLLCGWECNVVLCLFVIGFVFGILVIIGIL